MPQTTIGRGNILYDWLLSVTLTWSGTVGATSTAELTAAIPGLQFGDYIDMYLIGGGQVTGLTQINFRVSAPGVLAAQFSNSTAGALTPSVGPYLVNVCRPESFQNLPNTAG